MRRISMYTLSATALMLASTAMPLTSLAAVSTYQLPYSNGNAYVIGIGDQNCFQDIGNQSGVWNQFGNWGQNNGWGTRPVMPDITLPDFIFPTPEIPGPELPDNPNTTPEEPTPEKPDHGEGQDAYRDAVVKLVNAERAKAGLNPLTVNGGVAEAAQTRAQEIKNPFSHTRPDGSSFSTILTQAGISYRGVGENIAYGQNSPEAVMQSWMNSSGHRANILNKDYTSIGVGHYKDASGTDYWTQIFIY